MVRSQPQPRTPPRSPPRPSSSPTTASCPGRSAGDDRAHRPAGAAAAASSSSRDAGAAAASRSRAGRSMDKAKLTLYDPAPAPAAAASPAPSAARSPSSSTPRKSRSPSRPSGSARPTKGSKKAGPPEFTGAGALQADPGDVLRRHRQPGRLGGRGGRAAVQLLRADRGERRPEEAVAAAGGAALGLDLQLPGVRHLGQREVHPVHRRRHCRSGRCAAWPWRRCRASRSGRTRPRAATTSAGCTAPWPATPWPRSRTPSTATRRRGGRWPRSTGSTTRCGVRTGTHAAAARARGAGSVRR